MNSKEHKLPITNFIIDEIGYNYRHIMATPAHGGSYLSDELWSNLGVDMVEKLDVPYIPKMYIEDSEQLASSLYNTKQTFYFTTGVSHAILVGLYSVIINQDEVVISRNSHISVYSALTLIGAKIKWLIPENIFFKYSLNSVKNTISKKTKALILTNPSYDGYINEIQDIALFCKEKGILLIVDESLGSHWCFSNSLPKSSIELSVDIVFHSLHKRLGALVPSALLHIPKNSKIQSDLIKKTKSLLSSTSPSNLILISIENTIHKAFKRDTKEIDTLIQECRWGKKELIEKGILLDNEFVWKSDPFTINIKFKNKDISILEDELFEKYKINYELVSDHDIILFISFIEKINELKSIFHSIQDFTQRHVNIDHSLIFNDVYYGAPVIEYDESHLQKLKCRKVILSKTVIGTISNELYAQCPPGIPILFPGERINDDHFRLLKDHKISIVVNE